MIDKSHQADGDEQETANRDWPWTLHDDGMRIVRASEAGVQLFSCEYLVRRVGRANDNASGKKGGEPSAYGAGHVARRFAFGLPTGTQTFEIRASGPS